MFKVQNSWGTHRGDNGFLWVAYDAVPNMVRYAYVAYPVNTDEYEFMIEGSSKLCDVETYSIRNVPEGATVEWDSGLIPGMMYQYLPIILVSGQGTPEATFRRGGRSLVHFDPETGQVESTEIDYHVGDWTIKATVTLNGNTYVMEKTLTMPEDKNLNIKDANSTSIFPITYFGGAEIKLALINPVDLLYSMRYIKWSIKYVPSSGVPAELGKTEVKYGNSVTLQTSEMFGGTIEATVTDLGGCPSNTSTYSVKVIASVIQIKYTNPASGSVDISVVKQAGTAQEGSGGATVMSASASQQAYEEPYMGEYRLELWHEVYGMVREMDVEAGNPTVTMDLGGLTPGWYYVRIIADGEMKAVGKLMVR